MNRDELAALLREAFDLGHWTAMLEEGYSLRGEDPPLPFDEWLEDKLEGRS